MSRWPMVKLRQVLEPAQRPDLVDATREYRLLGVRLESRGPFLREIKTGAETSAKTLFRVRAGDFIYSRLFAWRGAFGVIPPQLNGCYVSNEFPVFVSRDGGVDPEYLNYWFRLPAILERIAADCTGSTPLTRNRYKERFFLELEIPLPPIEEQRRVVEKLNRLTSQLGRARRLHGEATRVTSAIVLKHAAAMFDGLAEACEVALLDDVCETASGGTPSRSDPSHFGGDIPWVKSGELGDSVIEQADESISPQALAASSAKVFAKGTIVVAMYGATVGKTGVLGLDAATNQAVCALFPDERVDREYLWWFLRRMRPEYVARSFGGAQPNISQRILRGTPIPLPSLAAQQAVVRRLELLEPRAEQLSARQERVRITLDAVMAAYLSCELSEI